MSLIGVAAWSAGPTLKSTAVALTSSEKELSAIQSSAYYPNCDAARAAGVAPMGIGEPGYRSELDGDGDGEACEPYRGY